MHLVYPERDLGNDGEEGVTVEINKCAKCDSDDEKLPWAWLKKWWGWQWQWKVTLGVTWEMMGKKVWPLKLTNVPSVTVMMKGYPERDSGNDGEEGVTNEINNQTRCDLRD